MSQFWVHERGQCNIRKAFEDLKEVVDNDVRQANDLDRPGLSFTIAPAVNGRFMVERIRTQRGLADGRVVFSISESSIGIYDQNFDNLLFTVSVEWNREYAACYYVCHEGNLRRTISDLSEVSEKALFPLLFP